MNRLLSLALAGACALPAAAQAIPKINSISHEFVQRGSLVEVTFRGENLAGVYKAFVKGDAGVRFKTLAPPSATLAVEATGGGIAVVQPANPNELKLELDVATDAPLGSRQVRLATAEGISNPIDFTVSHLPEIKETGEPISLEAAQKISLPTAVTGRLRNPGETDFYRFAARKGQKIVLEILGQRFGQQIDSSLAVLDKNGAELARNEDSIGNDSVIIFDAPADDEFVASVRDFRLQGGGGYRYRLLIGELPFVSSSFPFGGRRGEPTEIQLTGANLAGGEKFLVQPDSDTALGRRELRTVAALGLSNPFPFEVSDLPHFNEAEPNTAIDQADVVQVPGVMNGRIQAARDWDAFEFRAQKDQRLIFEVAAAKFGSPLDALLTLTDASGNVLQRNDDSSSADARIDHTFGAEGDYVLIVEDLLERGGPNYGYRLSATRLQPDFEVRVVSDTVRLHRGGRAAVRCELTRQNGFGDTVKIVANGLPEGVRAEPLLLHPGQPDAGLLFITAEDAASLGAISLKLEASSVVAGKTVSHPVKTFAGDRAVAAAYVTVHEAAPFMIHAGQPMATVEQNQSVNLDAYLERRNGFAGEVKISLEGYSAGREPVTRSVDYQPLTLKGTDTRGSIAVKAKLDSEVGARFVAFKAEASINGKNIAQFSEPMPLAITQVPFLLSTTLKRLAVTALPPGSTSSAGEAVFAVRAERRAGFNGEIALKFEGVPEGVTLTGDKIPEGAGETTVKLLASEKAPAGKEVQLKITGSGSHNDKVYRFAPADIPLQVNAPEPAETAAPAQASAAK